MAQKLCIFIFQAIIKFSSTHEIIVHAWKNASVHHYNLFSKISYFFAKCNFLLKLNVHLKAGD